jgi:WD40 repeat protein
MDVAFAPKGDMIAVSRQHVLTGRDARGQWATTTNEIELCRVRNGDVIKKLHALTKTPQRGESVGPFQKIEFSPDGRTLLGCSFNGDAALMNVETGNTVFLRRGTHRPSDAKYSHLRYRFIGFSRDSTQVLLTEQWRRQAAPRSENKVLHRAYMVTLDTKTGALLSRVPLSLRIGEWPERVAIMPDRRILVCSTEVGDDRSGWSSGGKVLCFDVMSGQRLRVLQQGFSETIDLACSPTKALVAVSWEQSNLEPHGAQLFDLERTRSITVQTGAGERPSNFTFSPDGKFLAGISGERIRTWDTATGRITHNLGKVSWKLRNLRLSPDGQTLAWTEDKVAQIRRAK